MKAAIRRPPAYQEYGSDMLGLERVKLMGLGERGLLWTMRNHCWANDSIPADPAQMARVLGLDEAQVQAALTAPVLTFFAPLPTDPRRLYCPELAAQLNANMARRQALSDGGRTGGQKTQRLRRAEEAEGSKQGLKAGLKPPEKKRDRDRDETELGKDAGKEPLSPAGKDPFVQDLEAAERRERDARKDAGKGDQKEMLLPSAAIVQQVRERAANMPNRYGNAHQLHGWAFAVELVREGTTLTAKEAGADLGRLKAQWEWPPVHLASLEAAKLGLYGHAAMRFIKDRFKVDDEKSP